MFKVGDKVIYNGSWTGDGWVKGNTYTVDKVTTGPGKTYVWPKEVITGNDYDTAFQLVSSTNGAPLSISNGSSTVEYFELYSPRMQVPVASSVKSCECGATKIGSVNHSTWCVMYGENV